MTDEQVAQPADELAVDQIDADVDELRTAEQIAPDIEALILLATEPISAESLAAAVHASVEIVEQTLTDLADFYDRTGRGFQLQHVAGGWRYATRPAQAEIIGQWVIEGQQNKLSQAALETLAVIAYLQPVPRSRVSAVRGVNVDGVVRTLLTRGLIIQEGGEEAGTANLLRTTDYFLERLGIASLAELPPIAPLLPEASELEAELAGLAEQPSPPAAQPSPAGQERPSNQEESADE